MARNIDLPANRFAYFLTQLTSFSALQASNAEAWILRGDWTYKGKNGTIELSDFYPTTAQVESVKGSDMRLISTDDLRKLCETYRDYGRQDERENSEKFRREVLRRKEVQPTDKTPETMLNEEIAALRLLLGKLRTQHAALVLVGFSEVSDFEEWYKNVNDAIVEVATKDHVRRGFVASLNAEKSMYEEMQGVAV